MELPPHDLKCPDPQHCPVVKPRDLSDPLPVVRVPRGTPLYRVYDSTWVYDEPNPGFGDSRFAPFDAIGGGRIPALYVGESETTALLETVFHDVHQSAKRWIMESHLRKQLLAHVALPADLDLVDLRDEVLADAGVKRDQLVSSPSEHYPCTRLVAQYLHYRYVADGPAQGLLWHSRQAELAAVPQALVLVVFTDSHRIRRSGWERIGPGAQSLLEGAGRLLVDEIASSLNAVIVRD